MRLLFHARGARRAGLVLRCVALLVPDFAQGADQAAVLTASDGAASDRLGVHLASDGDVLVVGASFDDGAAGADQGAVYIYKSARRAGGEAASSRRRNCCPPTPSPASNSATAWRSRATRSSWGAGSRSRRRGARGRGLRVRAARGRVERHAHGNGQAVCDRRRGGR